MDRNKKTGWAILATGDSAGQFAHDVGPLALPRSSQPDRVILRRNGHDERFRFPRVGLGPAFEAPHVMHGLREGRVESPEMPGSSSLGVARTVDRACAVWGLRCPDEEAT